MHSSNISIQYQSMDAVLEEIKNNYKISFQLMIPMIKESYFDDTIKNISTIIVSCNHNTNWIDIQFSVHDLTDPIILDFFIYLSKKYKTIVLLGELSTTTANTQFIKIEHGIIQFIIAQQFISDQVILTKNLNLENSQHIFKQDLPEIGQAFHLDNQEFLDLDDWNNFFESCDRGSNLDSQTHFEEYIHLRWHQGKP